MTNTTTRAVDEFDPLDNPEVAAFYNRLRKQQSQTAADRYLLTVKPTGGMNAQTPAVATTNVKAKQHNSPQVTLVEPLPTPALPSSDVLTNVLLLPDEPPPEVEPALEPALKPTPTAVVTDLEPTAQDEQQADTPIAALETAEPPETTVCTVQADQADKIGKIDQADSPETAVTCAAKRERKPVRSTAAVKQAFEDALATFVEADKPFKRSHVVQKAGLGASFYDRYPSLRTKVDEAIADVGKPKTQAGTKTMASEANGTLSAQSVTPEQPLVTETVAPQTVLVATAMVRAESTDTMPAPTVALTGMNSTQLSTDGLSWATLEAGLKHWQQERDRIAAMIAQLELQLDEAIDNVTTHERVWALYAPRQVNESHPGE